MATGKNRKRIMITLNEDTIEESQKLAAEDKRTLSNYIEKVLTDIIKAKKKTEQ